MPPAIDLPLYWGYLPPAGRAAFHDAYGPVDDDALTRARVLSVSLWAALAEYAPHVGMPSLLPGGAGRAGPGYCGSAIAR